MTFLWTFIKGAWAMGADVLWLAVRYFKRKDKNEPQDEIDKARTDSAVADDSALNADLQRATDRMQHNKDSANSGK